MCVKFKESSQLPSIMYRFCFRTENRVSTRVCFVTNHCECLDHKVHTRCHAFSWSGVVSRRTLRQHRRVFQVQSSNARNAVVLYLAGRNLVPFFLSLHRPRGQSGRCVKNNSNSHSRGLASGVLVILLDHVEPRLTHFCFTIECKGKLTILLRLRHSV